jgi:hypothetical protein
MRSGDRRMNKYLVQFPVRTSFVVYAENRAGAIEEAIKSYMTALDTIDINRATVVNISEESSESEGIN